jgi:3-hydroxyisobutyrate dehydrogenase-like beta-hydroxyacid dehydrogenase
MLLLKNQSIGFVGLGLMGFPMCLNLIKAGIKVVATTRSSYPLEKIARAGAKTVKSPSEVAQKANMIIIMVANTSSVEEVLHGDEGIFKSIRSGCLVIDMGTTAVTKTRSFAAQVEAFGGAYVDAPVSGGTLGAKEGSLTIMAGGEKIALERARPILEILGARLTHVGSVGTGQVAKAANQVIVGLNIGAVAEALMLATHAGADPAKVREALTDGFADSRILEVHGQRIVDGAFKPGAKAQTQLKDLMQALELAAELGIELPATSLSRKLFDKLVALDGGEIDHSALIKVLDPNWLSKGTKP